VACCIDFNGRWSAFSKVRKIPLMSSSSFSLSSARLAGAVSFFFDSVKIEVAFLFVYANDKR